MRKETVMVNVKEGCSIPQAIYTCPEIDFVKIEVCDIISTSGDENEGEWDSQ